MTCLPVRHTECLLHNIMNACYAPEAVKGLAALREILNQETESAMREQQEVRGHVFGESKCTLSV